MERLGNKTFSLYPDKENKAIHIYIEQKEENTHFYQEQRLHCINARTSRKHAKRSIDIDKKMHLKNYQRRTMQKRTRYNTS